MYVWTLLLSFYYCSVIDPPSNVQLTGPDYLLTTDDEHDPHNLVTCSTDHSNPAATIDWVVEADDIIDDITEDNTATEIIIHDTGYKKISTLAIPAYNTSTITVRCISTIEDLGYSETSDDLVLDFLGNIHYLSHLFLTSYIQRTSWRSLYPWSRLYSC